MEIILDDGLKISMEDFIETGKDLEPFIRDELDYQILTKLYIAMLEKDINKKDIDENRL